MKKPGKGKALRKAERKVAKLRLAEIGRKPPTEKRPGLPGVKFLPARALRRAEWALKKRRAAARRSS